MVADAILAKIQDKDLAVHVVWSRILRSDTREEASKSRAIFTDPRVRHYWDGGRDLGLAYGRILDLPRGRPLAWDIYFAFGRNSAWKSDIPAPDAWAHQLGNDARLLGDGSALRAEVERLLREAPKDAGESRLGPDPRPPGRVAPPAVAGGSTSRYRVSELANAEAAIHDVRSLAARPPRAAAS